MCSHDEERCDNIDESAEERKHRIDESCDRAINVNGCSSKLEVEICTVILDSFAEI